MSSTVSRVMIRRKVELDVAATKSGCSYAQCDRNYSLRQSAYVVVWSKPCSWLEKGQHDVDDQCKLLLFC